MLNTCKHTHTHTHATIKTYTVNRPWQDTNSEERRQTKVYLKLFSIIITWPHCDAHAHTNSGSDSHSHSHSYPHTPPHLLIHIYMPPFVVVVVRVVRCSCLNNKLRKLIAQMHS